MTEQHHFRYQAGMRTCPICGSSFECTLSRECWCASVSLPEEVRDYLARRYDTCVCRNCLETLAEKAGKGELS
ncbi:hypothetical protein CHL67_03700 [Prosthecochloris sp. GSB1]|uniref:cysteine-rich CWC family protein n=1 Tax=Prosthecochloris sp. GSB1 TaxID=281093 RepID=UPI000B8CB4C1|nr:cysteine-rich CWC family protein [Prosthecochloris sp. GSB1]ASQ90152.1 hypothetical protein CHL67_03700 [Prosthecochloris sp. GSB1]